MVAIFFFLNYKLLREPKATIGYVYEDSSLVASGFNNIKKSIGKNEPKFSLNDLIFDSDDDLDFGK